MGANIGWGQIDPDYIDVNSTRDIRIGNTSTRDVLPAYAINYYLSYQDSLPMWAIEIFAVDKNHFLYRDSVFHFHIEVDSKVHSSYMPIINHMLTSFRVFNDQASLDDCENP